MINLLGNETHTCIIGWWKFLDGEYLHCKEIEILYPNALPREIINKTIEITDTFLIGIAFVIIAGLLGSLIVEFLFQKLDLYLEIIDKKYIKVQNRHRLESMRGHP